MAELERGALQIDTLGLQLAEAKELLRQVQEVVIEEQVRSCLAQQVVWAICKERGRKAGIQPPAPHDLRRDLDWRPARGRG